MPTYDYVCDACQHEMEVFQNISADPLKKCPKCGKKKLRRLLGIGAGILFKGSGFYQTDYRSESYKKRAEAESKSSAPAGEGGGESTKSSENSSKAEHSSKKKDSSTGRSDGSSKSKS